MYPLRRLSEYLGDSRNPASCITRIRGLQYARAEYIAILEKYHMIPSMSRPANPYDNASCESFLKTLKREEIYAHKYEDREHLRANIEESIEEYYNRQRLYSALGYRRRKNSNERPKTRPKIDAQRSRFL